MSTFADSSALVKLYTDEADHEAIRALPALVVARLARVEVVAALWRKQRMGELSTNAVGILSDAFALDYFGNGEISPRFAVVAETTSVLEEAARSTAIHGLRAYDSVQLAAASAARNADPTCRAMAAFDTSLRAAAAAEGFTLTPPD